MQIIVNQVYIIRYMIKPRFLGHDQVSRLRTPAASAPPVAPRGRREALNEAVAPAIGGRDECQEWFVC